MVFDFLAAQAWLPFTICAIAMLGGALTLLWHMHESRCGAYVLLLSAALLVGGVGFLLGGMQAGENPVVAREVLIPWVRLCWLTGGGMALVFLVMYWLKRIDWQSVRHLGDGRVWKA